MTQRIALFITVVAVAAPAFAEAPADEAKRHYVEGTKSFNLTDYDHAIAEFEAAYRAKPDPVFLYNIAQSHRLAGHLEKAIRFYRNFLRLVPDTSERPEIERRIAEMEKALETQRNQQSAPPMGTMTPPTTEGPPSKESAAPTVEQPPPQPPTPTPTETTPPAWARPLRLTGIALLAAGVLIGAGGGVGFGLAADAKASAIRDQASSGQPFDPALDDARKTFGTLAIVSWVVGGALVATGGALLVVGLLHREAKPTALRLAPAFASGGGGLVLSGAF